MKKIVLFLSVFFFCGVTSNAQKIDKITFDKLVDYVNCKYTATYIELFRNDEKEKNNVEKYDNNVKSKLIDCTCENPVPFDTLNTLLINNGWSKTAKDISTKINEKKQDFQGNEMEAANAIELLKLDGNLGDKLKKTVNNLQKELKDVYTPSIITPPPTSTTIPNTEDTKFKQQINNDVKSLKNSLFWLWVVFLATWLILILMVLFIVFRKRKSRRTETNEEEIITLVLNSNRINKQFIKEEDVESVKKVIKNIEEEISKLNDSITNLPKEQGFKAGSDTQNGTGMETMAQTTKYLKGRLGNTFSVVSYTHEGCFFKVENEKPDNTADFVFLEKDKEAIAKRIFSDDICEIISGNYRNAQSVESSKGKVKFINGKWEVIEKIKIKFK